MLTQPGVVDEVHRPPVMLRCDGVDDVSVLGLGKLEILQKPVQAGDQGIQRLRHERSKLADQNY